MDDVEKVLQRMWRPARPSRRGPKAALSAERIVEAAFDLANQHGVEALSMARIAGALDVSPMALYRHVGSKDELLALLADRVARDLPPVDLGLGWREGLDQWTRAQVRLAFAYPWFLDLPLSNVMPGPNRLRWIDQLFGILADTPLDNDEKLALAGLLAQHVLGQARVLIESGQVAQEAAAAAEAGGAAARGTAAGTVGGTTATAGEAAAVAGAGGAAAAETAAAASAPPEAAGHEDAEAPALPVDPFASLEPLLLSFGGPDAFPHLLAALGQEGAHPLPLPMATPEPEWSADDEITFGLEILLDGIEAYVRRKEEAAAAGCG